MVGAEKNIKNRRGVHTSQIITGLCAALFFVFFNTNYAIADEYIHISQTQQNTQGSDTVAMWFTPTKNNISSLKVKSIHASSTSSWLLYFCHGEYDQTMTKAENGACLGSGQTELMSIGYVDYNLVAGINKFDFDDFGITHADGLNYFYLTPWHYNGPMEFRSSNNNPYADGRAFLTGGILTNVDWTFQLFYESSFVPDVTIVEIPGWTGTVEIGAEVGLAYNKNGTCIIGEPCSLRVNYGFDSISDTIYLNDYYGDQTETVNPLASSTLEQSYFLRVDLELPVQYSATTLQYCIYHEKAFDNFLYCDITIRWASDNTQDYFALYDCANVCDNISTTTSDFFYGIECGFKKILCWAFMPQEDTLATVVDSIAEIEDSFPFNTVFSFLNMINSTIANSQNVDNTLGVPFIDDDGNFYIMPVIASTSMPDTIGSENTSTFRKTIGYIIWAIVIAVIIIQIL